VLRNRVNGGPIINYDLLNLNIPMITCGSIIGVVFNNILPEFVISVFLSAILLLSLDKTYKRYLLQLRVEKEMQCKGFFYLEN
jgi:hypothetical protein